jgi:hypothetical protein
LILHYPFNGDILNYGSSTSLNTNLGPTIGVSDASFVPLTGSTVYLSSGQSIFKNGTSLYQSSFNTTDYLSINNIPTNTGGYTFSFWLYLSNTQRGAIFSFADALNSTNRVCLYQPNTTQWSIFFYGSQILNFITITSYLNTWTHFTLTFSKSNQFILYVNGVNTYSNSLTYNAMSFGYNRIFADTFGAEGKIVNMNDFRYYNRVLDIYEIKQLYNISIPLNNDTALVLYYPFNYDFLNYASGSGVGVTNGTPNSTLIQNSIFKFGKGSLFSNNSEFNNISFPSNSGNISISFWVYYNGSIRSGTNSIIGFGSGTNINFSIYSFASNNNRLDIGVYATNGYFENTVATIVVNTWYHIVLTMDVTNKRYSVYLNNVVRINNSVTGTITSFTPISSTNSSFNLFGTTTYFDDFRYYSRLLSLGEIAQLYNFNTYTNLNTILNLNTDPSLCLYYMFDLSRNMVSNYAQNVYGTIDASYGNGASVNYADLTYVGTGGLKLLGTNSGYVQLLPTSVVNTTNFISNSGMSFSCWFYSKISLTDAKIFDFNDISNSYSNNIFVSMNASNSISANVYTSPTTSSTVSLSTNYNNSILYHFVWTMTYSNAQTSNWNLYINATNVSSTTSNYYPNQVARSSDFLGKSNISSDPSFNGYIDDFRIYQRVLTQAEITQLYNYTNTLNVKSANLSWTAVKTAKTPLTYNYYYKDNSLNITPNILSYFSGLSWTAFYGAINDYTSIASTTTANSFQTNSRFSGGNNTKKSSASNTLTNINYPYTTIASANNIFGFNNVNNGDGLFISLIITGYFKPNQTGTWNFQFAAAGFPNDDFSIFWINDGANVNGTTTHWPPTDTNYNNYSYPTYVYSISLIADVYYPIQITWAQASGGSTLGFQFQPPGGSYTSNGSGYFFSQNSTPVNTSYTNSVINNLIDGNNITYSVNTQIDTKQSKYTSVTK